MASHSRNALMKERGMNNICYGSLVMVLVHRKEKTLRLVNRTSVYTLICYRVIAGDGFEPPTFSLWDWRATRLLPPRDKNTSFYCTGSREFATSTCYNRVFLSRVSFPSRCFYIPSQDRRGREILESYNFFLLQKGSDLWETRTHHL